MGDVYRAANLAEDLQARLYRQRLRAAIPVDRLSRDVLQHQEGRPIRRSARIQKPRDVGVFERAQDAPFAVEAPTQLRRGQLRADQLDGDGLGKCAVVAAGAIHSAHAAAPDLCLDAPGTDAFGRWRHGCVNRCDPFPSRGFEECAICRGQHSLESGGTRRVAARQFRERMCARVRGHVQQIEQCLLQIEPVGGFRHVVDSSCLNQALAAAHSRLTVMTDKPIESAISSCERPPK